MKAYLCCSCGHQAASLVHLLSCWSHCWCFIVGTILSAFASAGTWAEDAASAGRAYVLSCVGLHAYMHKCQFPVLAENTAAAAAVTSSVPGMLQINQNSSCSRWVVWMFCSRIPVCSGSLTWLLHVELWTVCLSYCVGSLLWPKSSMFSKGSALQRLPVLQNWLISLLNQAKFCLWVQLRTSSFFHTSLPFLSVS